MADLMVRSKSLARHYGMAGFGTAGAYAKALGLKEDAKQLAATSKDISAADKQVSKVADAVNQAASSSD